MHPPETPVPSHENAIQSTSRPDARADSQSTSPPDAPPNSQSTSPPNSQSTSPPDAPPNSQSTSPPDAPPNSQSTSPPDTPPNSQSTSPPDSPPSISPPESPVLPQFDEGDEVPSPLPSPPMSSGSSDDEDFPFEDDDIEDGNDYFGIPLNPPASRPMVNFPGDVDHEDDFELGWQWIERDTGPMLAPYSGFRQCLLDPFKNKPEDFFNSLFEPSMYTQIAEETNRYASQRIQNQEGKAPLFFLYSEIKNIYNDRSNQHSLIVYFYHSTFKLLHRFHFCLLSPHRSPLPRISRSL